MYKFNKIEMVMDSDSEQLKVPNAGLDFTCFHVAFFPAPYSYVWVARRPQAHGTARPCRVLSQKEREAST
jgi:hypothetical protein